MSLLTALRRAAFTLAAASFLLAIGASPAAAGSYEIRQCRAASGQAIGISDGFMTPVNMSVLDACGGDSGTFALQAANNTIAPWGSAWQGAGAQLTVPSWMPNTLITQIQTYLSVAPKNGDATLSYGHVLAVAPGIGEWAGNIEIPAGYWNGFYNLDYVRADARGARILQVLVQCYGPCDFQSSPTMLVHQPRITLTEDVAPNAALIDGTGLADGTPQRGTRTLTLAASDADSGVHRVEVRSAAGVLVASSPAGADCSYTRPAPCPQSRPRIDIPVDTTRFAEGSARPELWIFDAAGNVRKQPLAAFTVDNVPDPVPTPKPSPTPTATPSPTPSPTSTVTPTRTPTPGASGPPGPGAGVGSANGSGGDPATGTLTMKPGQVRQTVGFGAKVTITGRLLDAAGTPIRDARIDVLQQIAQPGALRTQLGGIASGPDGTFTYEPVTGSSRTVTLAYAPVAGATEYRSQLSIALTVRARVTFFVSKTSAARGTLIRFSGKLWVDPLPTRSARMVIETRARGGKAWFTAATVRTRDGGVFSWSGRFRSRGTFSVRARVLGSSDVAARPTASNAASVRVR